ncbi:uncharacterized protein N7484_002072 [Penicillium longicatenatum]|uniref:uncharacterized protein n=1 Tax=Penicillium longicatenatum TaxID=1561947 RepID=UPI0025482C9B|nr:uncharacterized protein N7484_002072 [Penicillium longicatenatum]KAJ5658423.1 hypothetical protein N7484_002072 [Penicillium longicatenatum]
MSGDNARGVVGQPLETWGHDALGIEDEKKGSIKPMAKSGQPVLIDEQLATGASNANRPGKNRATSSARTNHELRREREK